MKENTELQLTDEGIYPDEIVLQNVLGRSYGAYLELLNIFSKSALDYEWNYYKDGKAWFCKVQLKKKKKTIAWISIWSGYVKAAIYIVERLASDLESLPISESTKELILSQKNVGKLKPCIFEIRNKKCIKDFETVMQFKITAK